jgi:centromere protein I
MNSTNEQADIRLQVRAVDTNKLRDDDLNELTQSIQTRALSSVEVEFILNVVITRKISLNDKITLITTMSNFDEENCTFNSTVIHAILSIVTTSTGYYNDGRKLKRKVLPTRVQLVLLEWLIKHIHCINNGLITLNQCLPILFALLSFEYLRPQVANLISLAILKNLSIKTFYNRKITHSISSLKNWYIDITIALFKKFPLDDSLKWLLLLFRSMKPSQKFDPIAHLLTPIQSLQIPLIQSSDLTNDISSVVSSAKRRKLDYGFQAGSPNKLPITSIHSPKDLIHNFANINAVTINTLFDGTSNKFKTYYVLLHMLSQNSPYQLKLDYVIRFALSSDYADFSQLKYICDSIQKSVFCGVSVLEFPLIVEHLFSPLVEMTDYDKYFCQFYLKIRMLALLKSVLFSDYDEKFFQPTVQLLQLFPKKKKNVERHKQLVSMFVLQQLLLFNRWYGNIQGTGASQENFYIVFNTSILGIYKLLECIPDFDTKDMLLLKVFDFIRSINLDDLNRYFEDKAVLAPPSLLLSLFFSNDPFVCSQLCGYINHCKGFDFKNINSKLVYQQFTKDLINFIWRDKPFHSDEDTNISPFFLDTNVIAKFQQLPIFNFSYMLNFSNVGSIFHNPAWSYITAQLLWKLEDKNDSITIRHQGPVTQSTIANLNSQHEEIWLNWSFEDVKLNTLKQLDKRKFTGLCDLLFSSLKSLADKRGSS